MALRRTAERHNRNDTARWSPEAKDASVQLWQLRYPHLSPRKGGENWYMKWKHSLSPHCWKHCSTPQFFPPQWHSIHNRCQLTSRYKDFDGFPRHVSVIMKKDNHPYHHKSSTSAYHTFGHSGGGKISCRFRRKCRLCWFNLPVFRRKLLFPSSGLKNVEQNSFKSNFNVIIHSSITARICLLIPPGQNYVLCYIPYRTIMFITVHAKTHL
jgi:hypothetical protein